MDCDLKRSTDVVARRTLNAADGLQLVLSLYLCLGAAALKAAGPCAHPRATAWLDALFGLAALWLAHLLMHALTRRKRAQTELFFGLLGGAFLALLGALWGALAGLWTRGGFFGQCSSAHDLFGFVCLVLGAVGASMLAVVLAGLLLRLVRPKGPPGSPSDASDLVVGSYVPEAYPYGDY